MEFRWNDWNVEHIAGHGVSPEEAEQVVRGASRPYPRKIEPDKWLVWGRGRGGRLVQVVFVLDDEESRLLAEHNHDLPRRGGNTPARGNAPGTGRRPGSLP